MLYLLRVDCRGKSSNPIDNYVVACFIYLFLYLLSISIYSRSQKVGFFGPCHFWMWYHFSNSGAYLLLLLLYNLRSDTKVLDRGVDQWERYRNIPFHGNGNIFWTGYLLLSSLVSCTKKDIAFQKLVLTEATDRLQLNIFIMIF